MQRPAYEEPIAVETRFLSPEEREDSEQKSQSEENGVWTVAGVYDGREVAAWTEDQQAKHETALQELRNMDKFGVMEVVDRPQVGQVLWTRCVHKTRLDGTHEVRIVAGGFEQTFSPNTDFFAGTPKLTKLQSLLTLAAIHGNPVAFGDCQNAFHQSPVPSDSEPFLRGTCT